MPATGDDSQDGATLAHDFGEFAATWRTRAPLYASLADTIARDPELHGLLRHADPTQRLPVLLFAAVHDLLLRAPNVPLASWYPNLVPEARSAGERELSRTFTAFVSDHREQIVQALVTRSTQTNEIGRCGLLLPALGLIGDEVGELGHLDVGASGGLNLLIDRYEYRYTESGGTTTTLGSSTAVIPVTTSGPVPIPSSFPVVVRRCGLDRQPVDVTDPGEARWLEACVWPDHVERFERLVAAIDIARRDPPELLAGDAVAALAPAIARIGAGAHPVVTNSWVLNYLTADERIAYLGELDRIGSERDLSWVYAEAPVHIPELPNSPDPTNAHLTVLTMARWRNGIRTVDHLATCHPHGRSMRWR